MKNTLFPFWSPKRFKKIWKNKNCIQMEQWNTTHQTVFPEKFLTIFNCIFAFIIVALEFFTAFCNFVILKQYKKKGLRVVMQALFNFFLLFIFLFNLIFKLQKTLNIPQPFMAHITITTSTVQNSSIQSTGQGPVKFEQIF